MIEASRIKISSVWNRLIHTVGRRGAFLLFLTLLDLIYGQALLFPTHDATAAPTYKFLAQVAPLWAWGLLWITVGMACFVYAFRRYDAPAYALAMFLKVLWALTFLLGWIFAGVDRGYLATVIWGAFAAILVLISGWPEPSYQEKP